MADRTRQLKLAVVDEPVITERELAAIARDLGAQRVSGWSAEEEQLVSDAPAVSSDVVADFRQRIELGDDPLGDEFCRLRSPSVRREMGATFTPRPIVESMVDWAAESGRPARIVDPGTGSGRFLCVAARRMPAARLIGIEVDPLPALLARANLAVLGFADRARIMLGDYRATPLPPCGGPTLFIGNPPYVRHHGISAAWKTWLSVEARRRGHSASQLAGLHVHFFLATAAKAQAGDFGAFITAAEWLDVNYGSLVRNLFLEDLGGRRIVVIEPTAMPFPDAATTAAISYFKVGDQPATVSLQRIASMASLGSSSGQRTVHRERLTAEQRWSHLTRASRNGRQGYIELGELCRVHRGQVTGLNKAWIASAHSNGLPESVLFPCVTKARELFLAKGVLKNAEMLRCVIDLPVELDGFEANEKRAIERFLKRIKEIGAHLGYVATNRQAWWSVGLREPAPILATYMARRPPAFVRNRVRARHINIAHGLYPRQSLSQTVLTNLACYLQNSVSVSEGRTYAGGLTKFEPREMERLLIPDLSLLTKSTSYDQPAALDSAGT